MITIHHCMNCGSNFLIPEEYGDGIDTTLFLCPECHSTHWEKLSDSPLISKQLIEKQSKMIE